MKLKDAIAECRAVGFTLRNVDGEFQVYPKGFNSDHKWAAFESDIESAVDTARAMADQAKRYNLKP